MTRPDMPDPASSTDASAARSDDAAGARRRLALRLSIGANVLFVVLAGAIATRRWLRAREPASAEVYAEERRSVHDALPARPNAIVFVGDSLTDRGPWSELFDAAPVLNRGIAGDTTAGILARAKAIAAGAPARVFLLAGANDLAAGDAVPAIAERYGAILDIFRAAAPRASLYCQSVLPVRPPRCPPTMTNARIRELNQALRGVAAGRSCAFVDVAAALADDQGALDERFTLDGVHLTGAGYVAWARAIEPLVNAPR